MSNNLKTIKRNLYMLFWKYPELKNKNYNYLYFKYCLEFHQAQLLESYLIWHTNESKLEKLPQFWEKMPAMESISRCKRKLAKNDELFRPDKKEVIEARLNQTKNIVEEARKTWPYE